MGDWVKGLLPISGEVLSRRPQVSNIASKQNYLLSNSRLGKN